MTSLSILVCRCWEHGVNPIHHKVFLHLTLSKSGAASAHAAALYGKTRLTIHWVLVPALYIGPVPVVDAALCLIIVPRVCLRPCLRLCLRVSPSVSPSVSPCIPVRVSARVSVRVSARVSVYLSVLPSVSLSDLSPMSRSLPAC